MEETQDHCCSFQVWSTNKDHSKSKTGLSCTWVNNQKKPQQQWCTRQGCRKKGTDLQMFLLIKSMLKMTRVKTELLVEMTSDIFGFKQKNIIPSVKRGDGTVGSGFRPVLLHLGQNRKDLHNQWNNQFWSLKKNIMTSVRDLRKVTWKVRKVTWKRKRVMQQDNNPQHTSGSNLGWLKSE